MCESNLRLEDAWWVFSFLFFFLSCLFLDVSDNASIAIADKLNLTKVSNMFRTSLYSNWPRHIQTTRQITTKSWGLRVFLWLNYLSIKNCRTNMYRAILVCLSQFEYWFFCQSLCYYEVDHDHNCKSETSLGRQPRSGNNIPPELRRWRCWLHLFWAGMYVALQAAATLFSHCIQKLLRMDGGGGHIDDRYLVLQ